MQVYVARSQLTQDPVPVVASFDDLPWRDRNLMGSSFTVLSLPTTAVARIEDPVTKIASTVLASDWRSNASMIVNMEAQRRILESFSEFMQRNATNSTNDSLLRYGPDKTSWPQSAKDNQAAAEAGWDYVAAVREKSDALEAALPVDPTADSNWPTRIAPIYIESF
jgi:hypothetical protein